MCRLAKTSRIFSPGSVSTHPQRPARQYKLHWSAVTHDIDDYISLFFALHDSTRHVHHAEDTFAVVANDLIARLQACNLRR
jgi:hypothetical protein